MTKQEAIDKLRQWADALETFDGAWPQQPAGVCSVLPPAF